MRRFLAGVVALFLTTSLAFAQSGASVKQSGASVTPNTVPYWVTNGVIGDSVTAADSPVTSFGITSSGQLGICDNSARQASAGYIGLCFGFVSGVPTISVQNYGSASAQPLQFVVNGTTYSFPGVLASITIASTPVIGGINGDCLNVSSGAVGQVPCSILSAGTTGSGAVVLANSPTFIGTIGGNLAFSGNEIFTGNATMGSQLVVNGVSTPSSTANQTVVMGNISPPTLSNTGQAWFYGQSGAGATIQGDGSAQDITLLNKSGASVMQVVAGTTGVTFPGVLTLSGLSSGTCVASVLLNSSNQTITGSCPGAASSIQVGTTTVTSASGSSEILTTGTVSGGTGTLANVTVASLLTAGTGISITGTTNATVALTNARQTLPTVCQGFSGNVCPSSATTGTYTTPANVLWLEVYFCGGGGGGGGTGTASASSGGNGSASAFNSIQAAGGGGGTLGVTSGNGSPAIGGTGGTGGTGTATFRFSGSGGGVGSASITSTFDGASGVGGAAGWGFGGGGRGIGNGGSASAGQTPSGFCGGGSGGYSASGAQGAAGGGGGGEAAYLLITSPSASYSWTTGAAGTGGTAGSSGQAGGAGAIGGMYVVEHYGS